MFIIQVLIKTFLTLYLIMYLMYANLCQIKMANFALRMFESGWYTIFIHRKLTIHVEYRLQWQFAHLLEAAWKLKAALASAHKHFFGANYMYFEYQLKYLLQFIGSQCWSLQMLLCICSTMFRCTIDHTHLYTVFQYTQIDQDWNAYSGQR